MPKGARRKRQVQATKRIDAWQVPTGITDQEWIVPYPSLTLHIKAVHRTTPDVCQFMGHPFDATKTGVAPTRTMDSAVATNENGVVITSSPEPIPIDFRAINNAPAHHCESHIFRCSHLETLPKETVPQQHPQMPEPPKHEDHNQRLEFITSVSTQGLDRYRALVARQRVDDHRH